MAEFDVFLSYASKDLDTAEKLEKWLQDPPRNRQVWRDRRGLLPGAPDYYPPIRHAIETSAVFLLLLSPRWLGSEVAGRELSDAQSMSKKRIIVVHHSIARDPHTPQGFKLKSELERAVEASGLASVLKPANWIWLKVKEDQREPNFAVVEDAVAIDFPWAARHAIITERLNRWKDIRDPGSLLRGRELSELLSDAFADLPGRLPVLNDEQRAFLLESQRHETDELRRVEGLYWDAQTRAVAFAARERGEAEPDLALLLAAEAVAVAPVTEARSALFSLLHRHASLSTVLRGHGSGRWISGLAFSPDGHWLASCDRPSAIGDEREAHLLIHDVETAREWERVAGPALTALAWGGRWLAVASAGSIGWLRWDEFDEKFRGNTPVALRDQVSPDYLAFSPSGAEAPADEMLAWGTQWGDVGLVRVGDHTAWQGRLRTDRSSNALVGLRWLADGRLITAENGRVIIRPFPELEPAQEVVGVDAVWSLACDGRRWAAACRSGGKNGVLLGEQSEVRTFVPTSAPELRLALAGSGPSEQRTLIAASVAQRSGAPAVTLSVGDEGRETLLQGEDQLVMSVAGDSTGRFVTAGEMYGQVWLWDRDRRSHIVNRVLPRVTVRLLAISSAGSAAVVDRDDRILCFERGLSGEETTAGAAPFAPVQLLPTDGRMFVLIAEDGRLATLDGRGSVGSVNELQGVPELEIPVMTAAATGVPIVAMKEPGNRITVARICEGTLVPLRTIEVGSAVFGLALDSHGEHLFAVVSKLGLVVLSWAVTAAAGEPVELISMRRGGTPPVPMSAFDGRLVAGDQDDLMLVAVDEIPPKPVCLGGHDEPVKCIAAGADMIASVACWFPDTNVDQVRLWTGDGHLIGPIVLPEHAINLALLPDATAVIAVSTSGALWRLELSSERLIGMARRIAGRSLTAEEERRYGIDTWRVRRSSGGESIL